MAADQIKPSISTPSDMETKKSNAESQTKRTEIRCHENKDESIDSNKNMGSGEGKNGTKTKSNSPTISSSSSNSPKSKPRIGSAILSLESTSILKAPSKMTYLNMITACLRHLSDRNGSSLYAICKSMKSIFNKSDSPQIRFNINKALKLGVKEERFLKIKNSYKINSVWTKKVREEKKQKERERKLSELKRKREAQKAAEKKKKAKEEAQKAAEKKKKAKEEEKIVKDKASKEKSISKIEKKTHPLCEAAKAKAAELKMKAELAEKIRKRKFPMDDLELIKEDKLLRVRPPHPKTSPSLPLLMPSTPQINYSNSRRGIVSDIFQIFHFFRGSIGWRKRETTEFNLQNLFCCCEEIHNGNAKHNRVLPPLVVQLFVVALKFLTKEVKEYSELEPLGPIVNSLNWSEILRHYLDFMQTLSTSPSSNHVLCDFTNDDPDELPPHYHGYLGPSNECLAKAHTKLRKVEPCMLTAEECMCLLRSLCDDILGNCPELEVEINDKIEEMNVLTKKKRAAEIQWRKIKIAYNKRQKPTKSESDDINKKHENTNKEKVKLTSSENEENEEENTTDLDEKINDKQADTQEATSSAKVKETVNSNQQTQTLKPSKQQYEEAEKNLQKVVDSYDQGLRKLIVRVEPIGYDRNHCAVYHFFHDPEYVYLETLPNTAKKDGNSNNTCRRTWRKISCKSLFDEYVNTLDVRGIREQELEYQLLYKGFVRKHLYDDLKIEQMITAKKKEEETLLKRFENAKKACAESSRRSSRLVGFHQQELQKIEDEINDFKTQKSDNVISKNTENIDVKITTGYDKLKDFEKKNSNDSNETPLRCYNLWSQHFYGGSLGPLIKEVKDIETKYAELLSQNTNKVVKYDWSERLKCMKSQLDKDHILRFGSEKDKSESIVVSDESQTSKVQSRRSRRSIVGAENKTEETSDLTCKTTAHILNEFKKTLLDLEEELMEISGKLLEYTDRKNAGGDIEAESDDENYSWKKKIHSLRSMSDTKSRSIRIALISAIASAQKAQLVEIASELRSSLKLLRKFIGREAKEAALATLEKHGGYNVTDEEDTNMEADDDVSVIDVVLDDKEASRNILSEEAVILDCHFDNYAIDRDEWRQSVHGCKTLSRFSALFRGFTLKATALLHDMKANSEKLKDAIESWKEPPKTRKAKVKISKKYNSETKYWVNSEPLETYILAKISNKFPWWPARVLKVKNSHVNKELKLLDRVVISLIGKEGHYVLMQENQIKEYTHDVSTSDVSNFDEDIVSDWMESVDIASRIIPSKWDLCKKRKYNISESAEEEKKSIDN